MSLLKSILYMKKFISALLLTLAFCSMTALAQSGRPFPYPRVPSYIASDSAAAEWMALHFWDNYHFDKAESDYSTEQNRRGFVAFIETLYTTNPALSIEAVAQMMERAATSEDGYWYFLEMAEVVLYDPSSPMRNDLLWEPFLRHAIGPRSPLDAASKKRYETLLELVSRNQQGSVATDFAYTLADGTTGRLHSIRSPYLLIYFYNPGCSECGRTKAQLDATGLLESLHARGVLKVLALHPDGELSEWRRLLPENPSWWISAYDKGEQIHTRNLYDLKAIPTFYLLDSDKRVLMKDPVVEDLIYVLSTL